jgi:hypothetical protein
VKNGIFLLIFIILIAQGCVDRIPLYSPRQTDTLAHREASVPSDCLDCHDLAKRASHDPTDDCLSCHKIIKGN